MVEFRENTGTFLKVVSLEAGQAVSGVVVRGALIGNGGADIVGVEDPSVGAGEADLVVPVPGSTSGIGGVLMVEVREDTSTIFQVVSLETGQAKSFVVVRSALIGNGNTNFVIIEHPSKGA